MSQSGHFLKHKVANGASHHYTSHIAVKNVSVSGNDDEQVHEQKYEAHPQAIVPRGFLVSYMVGQVHNENALENASTFAEDRHKSHIGPSPEEGFQNTIAAVVVH